MEGNGDRLAEARKMSTAMVRVLVPRLQRHVEIWVIFGWHRVRQKSPTSRCLIRGGFGQDRTQPTEHALVGRGVAIELLLRLVPAKPTSYFVETARCGLLSRRIRSHRPLPCSQHAVSTFSGSLLGLSYSLRPSELTRKGVSFCLEGFAASSRSGSIVSNT